MDAFGSRSDVGGENKLSNTEVVLSRLIEGTQNGHGKLYRLPKSVVMKRMGLVLISFSYTA